jgi:hypothetical protein
MYELNYVFSCMASCSRLCGWNCGFCGSENGMFGFDIDFSCLSNDLGGIAKDFRMSSRLGIKSS